jgi:GxxExxY protein
MEHEDITEKIIGAAIEVHRELGPGLLESAYEAALAYELSLREVRYERQKEMPVRYKGFMIEVGYRLDLLVEDQVIVELKAVTEMHPIYEAQLMTYLRLSGCRVGLLINFNVPRLKDGLIRRIV